MLPSDDLDQNALPAPAVELAVKDLLLRAKVQPPIRDCHDDLAAHHLQLQLGIDQLTMDAADFQIRLYPQFAESFRRMMTRLAIF